jgi:hypothetical protein
MILDMMTTAGYRQVEWGVADHINHPLIGNEVLGDPFLEKNGTSQLALLNSRDYAKGLSRIQAALRKEKQRVFTVDIELTIITGRKGD